MSEERPTTAQYMRQMVQHARSRWKTPMMSSDASVPRPVAPPSTGAAFPRLTDVQLQRLFGDEHTTLPRDVHEMLQEMERR